MNDTRVAELLDELTSTYDDRVGDWDRVAADAGTRMPRANTGSWTVRVAAVVAVAAAVAAVVLAWPFQGDQPGLLDRARAAIGDGPVLHAVLRGEWGGTLVDLASGERKPVYGENEVWFDTETGRTHMIERLGGVVQGEELFEPNKPAAVLSALGREYRQALESGTARLAGEDMIDGKPVVWITIHSELLPDVADGKKHEWAQQVAVSKQTYKPVAVRETRDGEPGPGTRQRVLELQLLARADTDFTTSRPSRDGTAFKQGREPISLDRAPPVLGRTPLWLGHDYDGLPLAQVYHETTSVGRQKRGPIEWSVEQSSIVLFYGSVGDDPTTYLDQAVPLFDKRFVTVTESLQASPFRRGAGTYVPPAGSIYIAAGKRNGFLRVDGIHVSIQAADERAIVAAARVLAPMSP